MCITMEACASYGAMVLIQFAYGVGNILITIALEKGLNQFVFVVYRHIIAMLLLGPFAYVIERLAILVIASFHRYVRVSICFYFLVPFYLEIINSLWSSLIICEYLFLQSRKHRPSLSFSVITKIFLLSSLGTTIHLNVYYAGLAYTSPTVASALSNVIPSLTFLIAVVLRYILLHLISSYKKAF
jgi:drug/metabolite transporter (DMT)-like permease